jgi:hypothetical protein
LIPVQAPDIVEVILMGSTIGKLRPVKIGDSVDDGALVACQVG